MNKNKISIQREEYRKEMQELCEYILDNCEYRDSAFNILDDITVISLSAMVAEVVSTGVIDDNTNEKITIEKFKEIFCDRIDYYAAHYQDEMEKRE